MRRLSLVILALLCLAWPAAAADPVAPRVNPLLPKAEPSATDMLQNMILGKLKGQAAPATKAAGGTTGSSGSTTAERMPRKTGTAAAKPESQTEAVAPRNRTAKPRPTRQAAARSLPRLKPAAPISGSPTIQLPQPIPMPPAPR